MSFRIEIEAESGEQAAVQVRGFISGIAGHFYPRTPSAEPAAVSEPSAASSVVDNGASGAAAEPAPSTTHPTHEHLRTLHTRPGRPRDSAEVRAAKLAAKAAKNTPAGEGPAMADPASQPAVENTGSAQPAPLSPGDAASEAAVGQGVASTSAAAPITEDTMRQALNVLVNTVGGGGDAGMVAGAEILNKYGYARIREIKPEHYANITADAEAAIAKHKAA